MNRILGHLLIPGPQLTKMLVRGSQYLSAVKVAIGIGDLLVVVIRLGRYNPIGSIKDRELLFERDRRQPA